MPKKPRIAHKKHPGMGRVAIATFHWYHLYLRRHPEAYRSTILPPFSRALYRQSDRGIRQRVAYAWFPRQRCRASCHACRSPRCLRRTGYWPGRTFRATPATGSVLRYTAQPGIFSFSNLARLPILLRLRHRLHLLLDHPLDRWTFQQHTPFARYTAGSALAQISIDPATRMGRSPTTFHPWHWRNVPRYIGIPAPRQGAYNAPAAANNPQNKQIPTNVRRNYRAQAALKKQSRRSFLWGVVSGGAGMLGLVWLSSLFHTAPQTPNSPASNAVATAPQATDTATAATPQTPGVIAQVSQVPANSAADFTLPSNSDPGVLVHLDNGKFVAYDAACTHAGCPVSYDSGSKLLLCPCHGAAFDPAKDAAVVQGPAQTPLTSVPIHVDNASGAISLSN